MSKFTRLGQISADVPQISKAKRSQQIRSLLKQLLRLFKQDATAENRQSLQAICHQLAPLAIAVPGWQSLVQLSAQAIANPHHNFLTLAPVIIRALKQGSDFLELNQDDRILPPASLTDLANSPHPYVLVPLDPNALAQLLRQTFTTQQIRQLVNALGKK